ncbi:MAG: glycoside hydrolase family 2 TIM barrel-domain containing protein [Cyclobacteriaceae bacterium]
MRIWFLVCIVLASTSCRPKQPIAVEIREADQTYALYRGGEPYFIKGAVVFDKYLDRLAAYGGNSIRKGQMDIKELNEVHKLDLSVLYNLPVKAQRDGMDYNNRDAVALQHKQIIEMVNKYKKHPAILMWSLGNELDFIPGNHSYNLKVWDAVNDLAKEIKSIDPYHPVLTVVGSINIQKIEILNEKCPNIDLLGVNEYGDLDKIPAWLREFGWTKPYVFTEWGPTGFWQVPNTQWGVPIEESSTEKAHDYKYRYEKTILTDVERCLGSYVFLWHQHQERTHTWFGMFDENGLETASVNVMRNVWTGTWPDNHAPAIHAMRINEKSAYDNPVFAPNEIVMASLSASDPDGDTLTFRWEILHEGLDFPYGGDGEQKPPSIDGILDPKDLNMVSVRIPADTGMYRLFAYIYDGNGAFATANIPFLVTHEDLVVKQP